MGFPVSGEQFVEPICGMVVNNALKHIGGITDGYIEAKRRRKKVEMLFAHLKRIMKLDRLRLRGSNGAKDEFHLAATAQDLRKLAKLIPSPA